MRSSDTNFQLSDYDAYNFSIAERINPGQNDVRMLTHALESPRVYRCLFAPLQAIKTDLASFAGPGHNGKLIHYAGWADQLISVGNSLHYYETVRNFTESSTNLKMDDFYRFFLVPGMLHWCV